MMTSNHHPDHASGGGYFVKSPRRTDAIGKSLRDAFDRRRAMPDDFADVVRALDKLPARH